MHAQDASEQGSPPAAAAQNAAGESIDLALEVLDNDTFGIVVVDSAGDVAVFNAAAERMTGYDGAQVVGDRFPAGLLREEDAAAVEEALAQGMRVDGREVQLRRRGGGIKDVILGAAPARGAARGRVYFFVDNTEKRHLQNLLVRSQKMEIVSEMAGGIAHDFNNLLSCVLGYSSFMLDIVGEGHELRSYLEIIERSARSASALTERLLTFSRYGGRGGGSVDCNALLHETVKILDRSLDRGIRVEMDLERRLAPVRGAAGALETALLNVCLNARDAMPDVGRLTIETANVVLDADYAKHHAGTQPGAYVMLAISDTGHGMDAETLKQVFEPFFTTKGKGKGTGLGLSTVYGIVKQHGGSIWTYSEPGSGTTFKIYLPQAGEADAKPTNAPTPMTATDGTETVLLVEDEATVRRLARRVLDKHGYTVIEAQNGADALAVAAKHEAPIHLLLTDVIMPVMNGKELHEQLLAVRPDLKVLYMSGYTDNVIAHHGILERDVFFLEKPFSSQGLVHKVRQALDAPTPSD